MLKIDSVHRILFSTDTPLLGGAENQMLTLARFLPRDRYRVTLACGTSQNLNPWCQQFLDDGMEVVRLPVAHKHDPRHFFYLKKLLKNADLLHLHVWNPASGRYAFLASGKIPLVVTEHDPFPLTHPKQWIKQKLLSRASRVIVASHAARELVATQDPALQERITVIPNGIDAAAWATESRLENRHELRKIRFGATDHDTVILCVAELHERKGQRYLIEALQRLIVEFPKLKLAFVGDGPQRSNYKKMALALGDRAIFLGRQKDIGPLMALSDLLVLPSIREAFGLVLLEAAAAGTAIVASNVGGIPEIIKEGITGLLAQPGDADDLAEKIRRMVTDPQAAARMAQAGLKRVAADFDAKIMAAKTARVYDECL